MFPTRKPTSLKQPLLKSARRIRMTAQRVKFSTIDLYSKISMILISAAKYLDTITPEFKSDVRLADIGICKGILEITKSNTKEKQAFIVIIPVHHFSYQEHE
jgi:hypothetical protein